MKRFIVLLPLMLLILTGMVHAQPLEFDQQTESAALIGSYYNAITLKDYARAYNYWEQAPGGRTEAQFAAGFADTVGAHALVRLPIFSDAGAGNIYASLPTIVVAERTDGNLAFFAGCFTAHKTNVPVGNATEPDPNWYIREGSLRQVTTLDLAVLEDACENTESLISPTNTPMSQLDPVQLIQSYFIGLMNGTPVASYWQGVNGDVFMAQYGQQMAGAQNVSLYINPEIFIEGAAGSAYADIPALALITTSDGAQYNVTGCFTARKSNVPVGNATEPDPNWYFEDAVSSLANDTPSAVSQVTLGCVPAEG